MFYVENIHNPQNSLEDFWLEKASNDMSILWQSPLVNKSTGRIHDHTSPGCRACTVAFERSQITKMVEQVNAEGEGIERYAVSLALASLRKQGNNGRKLVKSIQRMAKGKFGTRAQYHGIIAAIIQQKDPAIRIPLTKSWVANARAHWNKLCDTPKEEMEH